MPVALVALVLIPAIAGSLCLVELAGGPLLLPANPRITASPAPVVVHITSAVAYETLGTFQFSSGFRRRRPGWHRASGRVGLRLMRTLERPLSIVTLMPRALGARGGLAP